MKRPKCCAPGCDRRADVEVILYDFYPYADGMVFFEQDDTCPWLCMHRVIENEEQARGERKPRGYVEYPYSNLHGAQGFTIYRPLDTEESWPRHSK